MMQMTLVRRIAFVAFAAWLASSAGWSRGDDWPQWRGPTRDGVWREDGLLDKFADTQLKVSWRQPIASGYSGPTVAEGRVYVTDRVVEPKQVERVHCFDSKSGEPLWNHSYDCTYRDVGYTAGPRASVSVDDGRAYSLGSMGDFFCFDAASGKVLWNKDLNAEYKIRMPIWGIAASPLVENDLVIVQVGGEGACLVAFDKRTGAEAWRALDDQASYSAPIMIEQAGRRVLVCWTGDSVVGMDAKTGKVFWQFPFKPAKMVINVATPVFEKNRLFFTSFYDGSLMLAVSPDKLEVESLWRRMGATSSTPTDCIRSSAPRTSRTTLSMGSTVTANSAAWMPRPASASGRACSRLRSRAGARFTWSKTARGRGCSTNAAS